MLFSLPEIYEMATFASTASPFQIEDLSFLLKSIKHREENLIKLFNITLSFKGTDFHHNSSKFYEFSQTLDEIEEVWTSNEDMIINKYTHFRMKEIKETMIETFIDQINRIYSNTKSHLEILGVSERCLEQLGQDVKLESMSYLSSEYKKCLIADFIADLIQNSRVRLQHSQEMCTELVETFEKKSMSYSIRPYQIMIQNETFESLESNLPIKKPVKSQYDLLKSLVNFFPQKSNEKFRETFLDSQQVNFTHKPLRPSTSSYNLNKPNVFKEEFRCSPYQNFATYREKNPSFLQTFKTLQNAKADILSIRKGRKIQAVHGILDERMKASHADSEKCLSNSTKDNQVLRKKRHSISLKGARDTCKAEDIPKEDFITIESCEINQINATIDSSLNQKEKINSQELLVEKVFQQLLSLNTETKKKIDKYHSNYLKFTQRKELENLPENADMFNRVSVTSLDNKEIVKNKEPSFKSRISQTDSTARTSYKSSENCSQLSGNEQGNQNYMETSIRCTPINDKKGYERSYLSSSNKVGGSTGLSSLNKLDYNYFELPKLNLSEKLCPKKPQKKSSKDSPKKKFIKKLKSSKSLKNQSKELDEIDMILSTKLKTEKSKNEETCETYIEGFVQNTMHFESAKFQQAIVKTRSLLQTDVIPIEETNSTKNVSGRSIIKKIVKKRPQSGIGDRSSFRPKSTK